jgi:hypothetical protein
MKDRLARFWTRMTSSPGDQNDEELANSCAGRIVNAFTFIVILLCLALWITIFLVLKDHLVASSIAGNTLTDLTCVIFFGGLVIAIFIGALAGNFMRRTFWRKLSKAKK